MAKTIEELLAPTPDEVSTWTVRTLVGELTVVRNDLSEALESGRDLRGFIEGYITDLESRIEKHDESGQARAWHEAWMELEKPLVRGLPAPSPADVVKNPEALRRLQQRQRP